MNAAAEDEIKRLTAAMDGPASFEPTIRAAMEFAYRDAVEACRDRFPYHLQPWAGELLGIEKDWGYAAEAIKAAIEKRLK